MSRRILVFVVALLSVIGLLGATMLVAWGVAQGWLPDVRRELIESALSGALDAEVQIGSVEGQAEDLTLTDLRVAPATGPELRIDRLQVRAGVRDLLLGPVYRIRSIAIDGLRVELVRDDQGRWQIEGHGPTDDEAPEPSPTPGESAETERSFEVGTVSLSNLELEARWRQGTRDGHASLRGDVRIEQLRWPPTGPAPLPSRVTADLVVAPSHLGEMAIQSGRVTAALEEGRMGVQASELELTTRSARPLARLDATARADLATHDEGIELASFAANLSFDHLDLAAASSDARLQSDLSGSLRAALHEGGASGEPALDLRLEVAPTQLGPFTLDPLLAHGRFFPGSRKWQLDAAELAGGFGKLVIAGRGDHEIEALRLTASDLDLAVVPRSWLGETPIEGRAALELNLRGPFDDPLGELRLALSSASVAGRAPFDAKLTASALGAGRYRLEALEATTLAAPQLALGSVAPAELRFRNRSARVEGLHLRGTAGELRLSGALEAERWRQVRIDLDRLDLRTIDSLGWLDVPVGGVVTAAAELDGPLRWPRIEGTLEWREPQLSDLRAEGLWLTLAAPEAEAMEIHAELGLQGRRPVALHATLPGASELTAATSFLELLDLGSDVRVEISDFGIGELQGLLGEAGEKLPALGGTVEGQVRLRGPLASADLTGSIRWTEPQLESARADSMTLALLTQSGQLRATLDLTEAEQKRLRARAYLSLADLLREPARTVRDDDSELEIRARELELAWLLERTPAGSNPMYGVEGTIDGLFEAHGSADGPVMRGNLRVEGARFHSRLLETPLGPINGAIDFADSEIRIESLEVESKNGTARLDGTVGVSSTGLSDVALEARFDDFRLTQVPFVETRIDGSLALRGKRGALHASGAMTLEKARLAIPDSRDPIFKEVRILGLSTGEDLTSIRSERRELVGAYGHATADVSIEVAPGARLRGRGLDLDLVGSLQLAKRRGEDPELLGSLRATGGSYRVRGRTMRVDRGSASFTQGRLRDPLLDVMASYQVDSVNIQVELVGRASELSPRLSSTPPMDDTEILSYLLFGKPSSEIGQGDSSQLQATVAQVAGGVLLDEFGEQLAETLWVDRVTIGVDEEATLPTIGVEKQITDDILVRFDKSFRSGGGDRFEAEWRFWRRFNLQSDVTTSGESGANLIWSFDY